MPQPIEFFFDYSSPYGYLAACRIEALAARHGRDVNWHPILLGAVFKVTGGQPLPTIPIKGDYARRDMPRMARLMGIPFRMPTRFPIASQAPARIFHWLAARDQAAAKAYALAAYSAYFVDDRDVSTPDIAADVAAELGHDRAGALAAVDDPALKELLRAETQAALDQGVFGSPFLLVDGEPFWGVDRLDQAERWLATGGW